MCEEGRAYFPRGLEQPATGFRFSTDSLLLSSFASVPAIGRVLDLGTGCGVIPLGILLHNLNSDLHVTGLEVNPEMIDAARNNIGTLGFADRIEIINGNVCKPYFAPAESFDVVVSNPPYRIEGRGRSCPDVFKNAARFEIEADLDVFSNAAARMVRNRGRVCFVFLAERLTELINSFTRHRLEPKRIKFVHGRLNTPSKVVMIEAVKNGKPGLIVEPPVILYADDGSVTLSAVEYCSFIAK
ncbi:tRNA1(Val) (adenine(37)-N6)-methyltransferase [Maridesulfovibrio zosterae]|uniref:tRNA1(Val) (adenine(37)-N6)-methyltransferase n=1 Tax=Maridesulfovibrio zosterae TaxID=82171 RepID=UPI0004100A1B|nr:methyltransferase [Maridesulfovibrio zosterae]